MEVPVPYVVPVELPNYLTAPLLVPVPDEGATWGECTMKLIEAQQTIMAANAHRVELLKMLDND